MRENPYKGDQPTIYTEVLELAWIALVDELVANGQLDPDSLAERIKRMSNVVGKNHDNFLAGGLLSFAYLDKILRQKYSLEPKE